MLLLAETTAEYSVPPTALLPASTPEAARRVRNSSIRARFTPKSL
jgi:hypothetical protein